MNNLKSKIINKIKISKPYISIFHLFNRLDRLSLKNGRSLISLT